MSELWLKNKKVLTFQEKEGVVTSIDKIEDKQLLPLSLINECTTEKLNEWINKRSIPANREGLEEMMRDFGSSWLKSKNCLSLSDQYWVKHMMEEWKKINFFTNRYSQDIGDIAFSPWSYTRRRIDNNSPDLTTNGVLRKRWRQNPQTKKSVLIKAGSKLTHQEPLSEILVSVLLEQLNIVPFVRYDFCVEGVTLCSKCENFITQDTELVPVSQIYHLEQREKGSVYNHILRMCDKFEVPNMKEFLDAMIFIDCITGNEDRNLGNIALIRDVNTMKIIGPAPLFDFGAAYWSSGKINDSVKSKKFGDVENKIFNKMKKKCDIEQVLKSENFVHCIETYPRITEEKKENLIKAIKQRNRTLFLEKRMSLDGFSL